MRTITAKLFGDLSSELFLKKNVGYSELTILNWPFQKFCKWSVVTRTSFDQTYINLSFNAKLNSKIRSFRHFKHLWVVRMICVETALFEKSYDMVACLMTNRDQCSQFCVWRPTCWQEGGTGSSIPGISTRTWTWMGNYR